MPKRHGMGIFFGFSRKQRKKQRTVRVWTVLAMLAILCLTVTLLWLYFQGH